MKLFNDLYINFDFAKIDTLANFIVSHAGILVSIITLILGYRAYRKFLFQQVTSKQLDLVIELINSINLAEVNILINQNEDYGGHSSIGSYYDRNLFDIATWGYIDHKHNYNIFIPMENDFELIPFVILNNPILPKRISDSLYTFYNHFTLSIEDLSKETKYIAIGRAKQMLPKLESTKMTTAKFEGGLRQFVIDSKKIRNEINYWLKKHGVSDLNTRIFMKHYR